MSERQNRSVTDQESPRKPYTQPRLTRHGTVVELTHALITADFVVGSAIITDTGYASD
jgi:hypothetical protein